jgi:hypothetical protein
MKKTIFAALMAVAVMAQANTCTLISNSSGTGNYNCSLPVSNGGQQVTSCTFTFTSVSCPSSVLYCNLLGGSSSCNIGSCGSANTWTCTLDNNGLNYLNNCLNSGGNCNFGLNCGGCWNIGSCKCDYTCGGGGTPKNNVPDTSVTVLLLGATLLGLELSRRKLVPARAKK